MITSKRTAKISLASDDISIFLSISVHDFFGKITIQNWLVD